MVPVLVVMSGAIAFSAFSGSIDTGVSASAGTLSFNENATLVQAYASNTQMTVTGANGMLNTVGGAAPTVSVYPVGLGWASPSAGLSISYTANVANMAPGNWVEIQFYLTNNGTTGFILNGAPVLAQNAAGAAASNNVTLAPSLSDFGATGVSSGTAGFVYYLTSTPTTTSSIDSGHNFVYDLYIGLDNSSGNYWQGASFSFTFDLTAQSDA